MTSACNKIRIPTNESADDKSQIVEYLDAYNGDGIQHIALSTDDIYGTVETLKSWGIPFLDPPPDTYYDALDQRLPGQGENLKTLKHHGILVDGIPGPEGQRLLQIFTATVIGPIFLKSSNARGTMALAKATSRRCTKRWNKIKFSKVC